MGTVGVRELKNRLTHYLRRAKRGEEVVVTERGQPVAILQSIRAVETPKSLDARLAKLAAKRSRHAPERETPQASASRPCRRTAGRAHDR